MDNLRAYESENKNLIRKQKKTSEKVEESEKLCRRSRSGKFLSIRARG